ncbi:AEC family transporter, partial [Aliarcobacter butzleri]
LKGTNTQVPHITEDVCKRLGGRVIPLLLIAFGSSLVGMKIGQKVKAVRMGVVRVVLGYLVVYTIFCFGNFEPVLSYTL